jgi:anaerobic magnesium-protoporphyrin IX monomethyl ester cyclase
LGKRFRAMSASRVVEEFEHCIQMGIHEFLIYDDTFTVNRKRVVEICETIIERKLDIGFDIRDRVDTMDNELLHLLKLAGCRGVHYGIESGSEKILKVLKKGITIDKAMEVFRQTKKEGIQTLAYFMIGCPTETLADVEETFRVMRELDPDFLHLTILTPFPSTPLYTQALEDGLITHDYWRKFATNPVLSFRPPFWEGEFSRDELDQLIRRGYRLFYMRPSYILKTLLRIASFAEFKRKAKAGIQIAVMSFGRRKDCVHD